VRWSSDDSIAAQEAKSHRVVKTPDRISVQCRTGGRATLATDALKKIGFTNAVAVIMTWGDWVKASNPNREEIIRSRWP
jgi:rhodanese-related sulfurtransferase